MKSILGLAASFWLVGVGAYADPLDTWTPQNLITPTPNSLYGITYGNSRFVAVGDAGAVVVSADGVAWSAGGPATNVRLAGVTYGGGRYVAVGDSGAVFTSPDGAAWTFRQTGVTNVLHAVAYGSGLFAAVGDHGMILTSPDGVTWTNRSIAGVIGALLGLVYTLDSGFLGVGQAEVSSFDGTVWKGSSASGSPQANGIGYGQGYFVTVYDNGMVNTSEGSGQAWNSKFTWSLSGAAYGGGQFVVVGKVGSQILASADGITWRDRSFFGAQALNAVAYGAGRFVAVGGYGTILTSQDGSAWIDRNSLNDQLTAVAYGGGRFVVVGEFGRVATSTNGVNWSAAGRTWHTYFSKVAYGDGQFLLPGGLYTNWTSSNGVSWAAQQTTGYYMQQPSAIAFAEREFITVGDTFAVSSSPDGIDWTWRGSDFGADELNFRFGHVAYGNGTFVVVGQHSSIYTSTDDTITWSKQNAGIPDHNLTAIAYGNGQFVVWVDNGNVLVSSDGVAWTENRSGLGTAAFNYDVRDMAYGGGQWVAVGEIVNELTGAYSTLIVTSEDGVNWKPISVPPSQALYAVAYGGNFFLAVGSNGTILKSGEISPAGAPVLGKLRLLTGGGVQGSVTWAPGQNYRVQGSSDLATWDTIASIAASTNATVGFTDLTASGAKRRFYRAVSP